MTKHTPSLIPPVKVAKNAEKGLRLRQQFKRGGTPIGINRALQLKKREVLSIDVIKRMYSYFKRHEVDKKGRHFSDPEKPSNGYIAWLLWGGDEGYEWVLKNYARIKTADSKH